MSKRTVNPITEVGSVRGAMDTTGAVAWPPPRSRPRVPKKPSDTVEISPAGQELAELSAEPVRNSRSWRVPS